MPELPDVQMCKEYFDATSLKKEIAGIDRCDRRLLNNISPRGLKSRLSGRSFSEMRRYGKYLFARFAGKGYLFLHFGMTGFLKAYRKEENAPAHIGIRIRFADNTFLAFSCCRRLGHIGITGTVEDFVRARQLGPDALTLTRNRTAFADRMGGRRGSTKGALMNQKIMAGIGNIYADEILFQAGLHPAKKVSELEEDQLHALADTAARILETAIQRRAGAKGWPARWLLPRREEGRSCPRCSDIIRRMKVSGRNGYFCPGHQKG